MNAMPIPLTQEIFQIGGNQLSSPEDAAISRPEAGNTPMLKLPRQTGQVIVGAKSRVDRTKELLFFLHG